MSATCEMKYEPHGQDANKKHETQPSALLPSSLPFLWERLISDVIIISYQLKLATTSDLCNEPTYIRILKVELKNNVFALLMLVFKYLGTLSNLKPGTCLKLLLFGKCIMIQTVQIPFLNHIHNLL